MSRLNYRDYIVASDRWFEVCDPHKRDSVTALAQFTGLKMGQYEISNDGIFLAGNEETQSRIQMLLSPDYRTIIKAWCAKYKVDVKDENITS